MSVYKRGGKWWYEFTVRGERIRGSSGSSDRDVALLLEAEHRRSVELGAGEPSLGLQALKAKARENSQAAKALSSPASEADARKPDRTYAATPGLTPGMFLEEASEIWLSRQQKLRRPRTIESNRSYLANLLKFFGNIRLSEFHIGHFEHYQSERGKVVCVSVVNHALNVLSRILREVDLWHPIKRRYNPLRESAWKPPRIYTVDEQAQLFRKLKETPNLELIDIVFTITRNTTASGCELRGLRLRDVDLESDPARVHITPDITKNNIRPRTIPLNNEAVAAFRRALDRARRLGCHYPENYLFPLRVNRALWNPNKPASRSWLRCQTATLREKTGIEHIKPHTFRHLAVTELLEKGAPEETVIALAGWVGRNMIKTYSHTRLEAKADAVRLLDGSESKPREDLTPAPARKIPSPQPPPPDIMCPEIQAEIARQVALALQQLNLAPSPQIQPAASGLRLIAFPGAAARPNGGSL